MYEGVRLKSATRSLVVILLISLLAAAGLSGFQVLIAQQPSRLPWVSEIVYSEETDRAKAVERILAGDLHLYLSGLTADAYEKAKKAGLKILLSRGGMVEITVNPVECRDGTFNPFINQKIREALNYIVDREYVVKEIYKGLAVPRWTPVSPGFPEWMRHLDVVLELERKYSYDFKRGSEIISEEMKKLGAELVRGKWVYKGSPVRIKFLIPDIDPGKSLGDYFADQLEKLGFTVDRQYRTTREIMAIVAVDPWACNWQLFVGGWSAAAVYREEPWFAYWYTDMAPADYRQAFKPPVISEEFYEIARRIDQTDYGSLEERYELFSKAIRYSVESGLRIWIAHTLVPWAMVPEIDVIFDLAAGLVNWMYFYGLKFLGRTGGTVKTAQVAIFTRPVNPVAGAYTVAENLIILPTVESAFYSNPFTGLSFPYKVRRAEVYAVKGTPITKSSNWVELKFVDEIEVPKEAWWGWDSKTQEVVTVGEHLARSNMSKLTSRIKVVVEYEGYIFEKVKWHDYSKLSPVDFLIYWPLQFERADSSSPLYDESYVPTFRSWREIFKGMRIIKLSPLTVEYYVDTFSLDAENTAAFTHPMNAWEWWTTAWPTVGWHSLAVGLRAEIEGKLAFSSYKADKMKVEWMNYWHGPSIDILKSMLDLITAEKWVPWEKFLRKYAGLTNEEIATRYSNLAGFYSKYRHFWIGTGPFYVYSTDPVAKIAVLRAFPEYPEPPEKWAWLTKPIIPELSFTPPAQIVQGQRYTITVKLMCEDAPCPLEDIEEVKYYIFHEGGKISGLASPVTAGTYVIDLSSEITSKLAIGIAEIYVFGISRKVSIPAEGKGITIIVAKPETPTTPIQTPATPVPTYITTTITMTTLATVVSTIQVPVTITQPDWGITAAAGVVLLVVGIALGWIIRRR